MNIKNDETLRLTRELAALTGESLTGAVTEAVRERLERVRGGPGAGMAERLRVIARQTAPLFTEPWRSVDHGELLYDERGLPR